ncbi:proteasome assembly chaperone 4 domain-containing protein [Phthorimaea operculella]|nr:proteasome assembly chaperone 4 domain-containing protein [Phthorimaea operculella]KAI5635628.1 proteasome assembly chaperone 4 domain-containing protein [Phthorimaea operculella]
MPPTAADVNSEYKRSAKSVVYKDSKWRVHHFEVVSGMGVVCRAAALRVDGALLLWVGGDGPPALGAVALALPARGAGEALATPLSGAGPELESALALSRRLARALARPVHVCCGSAFDRFTAPLVERGLITEIKSRPDCF